MTSHHQPGNRVKLVPADIQQPADMSQEQNPAEMATISAANAEELGRTIEARLNGIDVMNATTGQSLEAMRAASLTTSLLSEALQSSPDVLDKLSDFRGPIDNMSSTAMRVHLNQTGHPLHEVSGRPSTYDKALEVLTAIKEKAEDRRWDGTHGSPYSEANPTTASGRKMIAREAVRGLGIIAEENGQALVSSVTAQELVEYLES